MSVVLTVIVISQEPQVFSSKVFKWHVAYRQSIFQRSFHTSLRTVNRCCFRLVNSLKWIKYSYCPSLLPYLYTFGGCICTTSVKVFYMFNTLFYRPSILCQVFFRNSSHMHLYHVTKSANQNWCWNHEANINTPKVIQFPIAYDAHVIYKGPFSNVL